MIGILVWILVYIFKCEVVDFKDENGKRYTAVVIPPGIITFKGGGENQPLFN